MTRYGPHRESDQPTHVVVLRPAREGGEHLVPVHPAIARQRAQLNDLAHFGYVRPEHTGRVPTAPFCLTCGRDAVDCVRVRHGDDDHVFEPSTEHRAAAPRPRELVDDDVIEGVS